MMHHSDSLKIRIGYFHPHHDTPGLLQRIDVRRIIRIAAHRYTLHASILGVTLAGAIAAILN
jgi:hypothetical protein